MGGAGGTKRKRLLHLGMALDLVAPLRARTRAAADGLPRRRESAGRRSAPLPAHDRRNADDPVPRPRPRRPLGADLRSRGAVRSCTRAAVSAQPKRSGLAPVSGRAATRRRRLASATRGAEDQSDGNAPSPGGGHDVGGLSRHPECEFSAAGGTARAKPPAAARGAISPDGQARQSSSRSGCSVRSPPEALAWTDLAFQRGRGVPPRVRRAGAETRLAALVVPGARTRACRSLVRIPLLRRRVLLPGRQGPATRGRTWVRPLLPHDQTGTRGRDARVPSPARGREVQV